MREPEAGAGGRLAGAAVEAAALALLLLPVWLAWRRDARGR